ncbi:TRAP transporter, DctM subunit [Bosea lupini]|uniref:TRAP transporter large permease protein n=1 Tax=Bosea lupini TaxID=1036779 RepID=A0A1H7NZ67_9HYPH|nr:TRAP transporter large permease [Bosea lupini]SEL28328.1 TRAP transporter, DctM subunit [Bosea lupini]
MITGAAFTAFLLGGLPIGLVLCLATLSYVVATRNWQLFDSYLIQLFGGIDSYGLLALPLFILVGEFMNAGGITTRLLEMTMAITGRIRGSLAYVNVFANGLISSILGSSTTQIAIMAQTLVPEMVRKGYDKNFAVATTVSAGLLGPIIPPSLIFVIYGVMVQAPIGDMFVAGIIPGLLIIAAFCLVIWLMGFWLAYPIEPHASVRERIGRFMRGLPTMLIPIVILVSIMTGLASPTESAALACVAALFLGLGYREIDLRQLPQMFLRTGLNTAIVLYLVAAANVFTWVLIHGQVPQVVASWMTSVASGPVSFMLWLNLILLVIGTVIDGVAGLILIVPILYPIATGLYGIDPIHFGVVVSINLTLGLVSPPVGAALFVGASLTNTKPSDVFAMSLPFCLATCVVLVVLSIWPWFTLALIR